MNNGIEENIVLYETVQEIWEVVRETYLDLEDTMEAFEIDGILHDLHQGDSFVTQYFSLLTRYWQQPDMNCVQFDSWSKGFLVVNSVGLRKSLCN